MKLLKLLAQKMDKEEQKCLPLLLNCFYYRETLFIVYELLRDNLWRTGECELAEQRDFRGSPAAYRLPL